MIKYNNVKCKAFLSFIWCNYQTVKLTCVFLHYSIIYIYTDPVVDAHIKVQVMRSAKKTHLVPKPFLREREIRTSWFKLSMKGDTACFDP